MKKHKRIHKISRFEVNHSGGLEFEVVVTVKKKEGQYFPQKTFCLTYKLDDNRNFVGLGSPFFLRAPFTDPHNFAESPAYFHFSIKKTLKCKPAVLDDEEFQEKFKDSIKDQSFGFDDLVKASIEFLYGDIVDEEIETAIKETEEYMKQVASDYSSTYR